MVVMMKITDVGGKNIIQEKLAVAASLIIVISRIYSEQASTSPNAN